MTGPRIASAPVNVGIYGGVNVVGVDRDALLANAAEAGHAGMELGPPGLFGAPADVARRFRQHGLAVVGAYVPLHLGGDGTALERDLAAMRRTLAELVAAGGDRPLAILADEGSPELLVNPARPWHDRRLALDGAGWDRLAEGVRRARALADEVGIRTTFHPHLSTYVESPWEVEELLARVPIGITLDTGHLRLAGADPVELLAAFGERVDHVHLKDVRVAALDRAKADGRTDFDAWWPGTCVPLGTGDAAVEAFLDALLRRGYDGWIVVEQDHPPTTAATFRGALEADARNAAWLRARLDRTGAAAAAQPAMPA